MTFSLWEGVKAIVHVFKAIWLFLKRQSASTDPYDPSLEEVKSIPKVKTKWNTTGKDSGRSLSPQSTVLNNNTDNDNNYNSSNTDNDDDNNKNNSIDNDDDNNNTDNDDDNNNTDNDNNYNSSNTDNDDNNNKNNNIVNDDDNNNTDNNIYNKEDILTRDFRCLLQKITSTEDRSQRIIPHTYTERLWWPN